MKSRTKAGKVGWLTSTRERLCYYSGFSGSVGESAIVQTYLNTFILLSGINLGAAAVVLLVIRVVDAVDDVIFGYLVDRIKLSRRGPFKFLGQGKYIPWMKLLFFFLPLTGMLIFQMPFGQSQAFKIAWFSITYFLFDLVYTLMDVPRTSAIMTLTDNTDERNTIIMQRAYPQLVIALGLNVLCVILISEQVGVNIGAAALLLSSFTLLTLIPIFGVKEHNVSKNDEEEKYSFRQMLKYLKSNKYLALLYGGFIVSGLFATGSAVSLFTAFYLFHNAQFSVFYVGIAVLPIILINAFIPGLAKKHDKFKMMFLMSGISVLTGLAVYLAGYGSLERHIILVLIHIIPSSFAGIMRGYLIQNCVEYGRYVSGVDGTGISFAIQTFAIKITGLASAIGIFILGLFGWVTVEATDFADLAAQGVTQSASALQGLWIVNSGIPVIGAVLAMVLWFFYRLSDKEVEVMKDCNEGRISREEAEGLLRRP
jgi:Na+/melibiose symporter-like transporter